MATASRKQVIGICLQAAATALWCHDCGVSKSAVAQQSKNPCQNRNNQLAIMATASKKVSGISKQSWCCDGGISKNAATQWSWFIFKKVIVNWQWPWQQAESQWYQQALATAFLYHANGISKSAAAWQSNFFKAIITWLWWQHKQKSHWHWQVLMTSSWEWWKSKSLSAVMNRWW